MTNDNAKERWCAAIAAAEAHYDADLYFYSGPIDDLGLGKIIAEVATHKRRDRGLLILVTDGGQANAGYQIARLFQKVYAGNLTVFCPSRCKSAGTLVALGADRLIMDQFSELGPLDVQLFKQNEIMARKSGLLSRSAFDALAQASFDLYEHLMIAITVRSQGNISFQVASDVSARMAGQLMSGVYSQVNPDIVGGEKRDLEIAKEYGERLIAQSGNGNELTVHSLVYEYPSHDFVIDDDEARTLFQNVEFPHETLYQIVGFLGEHAYGEATQTIAAALVRADEEEDEDDDDLSGEADPVDPPEPTGPVDDGRRGNRKSDSKAPTGRQPGGSPEPQRGENDEEDSVPSIRLLKPD